MQLCFICWILPTMATIQCYQGCTHLLFPFLHAEKFPFSTFSHATKERADICMHTGLEDVTNKNCLPNLVLIVNWWSHSAVQYWHHCSWYQCCEIWDLSTLADKLRIVFKTSKLKLAWWQFCFWKIDSHWKLHLLSTARHICQLNRNNNGFTTND